MTTTDTETVTENQDAEPVVTAEEAASAAKIRLLWVLVHAIKRDRDTTAAVAEARHLEMPDVDAIEAALHGNDDDGVPVHYRKANEWINVMQKVRPDRNRPPQPPAPAAAPARPATVTALPAGGCKFCPNCGFNLAELAGAA